MRRISLRARLLGGPQPVAMPLRARLETTPGVVDLLTTEGRVRGTYMGRPSAEGVEAYADPIMLRAENGWPMGLLEEEFLCPWHLIEGAVEEAFRIASMPVINLDALAQRVVREAAVRAFNDTLARHMQREIGRRLSAGMRRMEEKLILASPPSEPIA